ncbi:MAG: hypothetical protein Q8J99_05160, partial [Sulfuritalea sp.]|nr:hypothetical protein [Sulfuritalea sp.]
MGSKLGYKAWVVPGLNFSVKSELMISNRGRFFRTERRELVALRQQIMDLRCARSSSGSAETPPAKSQCTA